MHFCLVFFVNNLRLRGHHLQPRTLGPGDVGLFGNFIIELLIGGRSKHFLHLASKLLLLLQFQLDSLFLVIDVILLEPLEDFLLTSFWCFLDKFFVQFILDLLFFPFDLLLFEFGNFLLGFHFLGNQLIVFVV